MVPSLSWISRLALLALAGVVGAAVLLGHWAGGSRSGPRVAARAPREATWPRYHTFSGYLFSNDLEHQTRLLDSVTGEVTLLDLASQEGFDAVACSPWHDDAGQYHLAGRRLAPQRVGPEAQAWTGATGIARFTFPGGQLLDRVGFDIVPGGPPCWFPDRSDRVLFAACDGQLYDLVLPGGPGAEAEDEATPLDPSPIRWKVASPGRGQAHIQDPCWPFDEAMGGRLVVSLRYRRGSASFLGRLQLWWLQLSPDGRDIVAAGRLINAGRDDAPETRGEERLPCVGKTHDGVLTVAYVLLREGKTPGELWTAPIVFETHRGTRVPRVHARDARRLTTDCAAAAPVFSPDGRWIYAAVRSPDGRQVRVSRFALAPGPPREPLTPAPALTAASPLEDPAMALPLAEE